MTEVLEEERVRVLFTMEWQGVTIDVSYEPSWLNMDLTAHLELRVPSKEQLPVTDTGYRSSFIHRSAVECFDTPQQYVKEWLDIEADTNEWRERFEAGRQLSLF